MFTKAVGNVSELLQRNLRLILFVVFLSGLLLGGLLSRLAGSSLLVLVFAAGEDTASVLGLAAVLLVPLLISFFVFYYNVPVLVFPIAFIKAVIFGFCSCCIMFTYGDSGWLVRSLLLFSDSMMLVVLCWYWIRQLGNGRLRLKQNTLLCSYLAVLIGMVDYMYISPFAAMLLQR